MRIGVIDVGTNTARMAVFDISDAGGRESVVRRSKITRLGEDVNRTSALKPEAAKRTFETVKEYVDECLALGVEKLAGAGTSVLRDARDADSFVQDMLALGIDFKVVSGPDEARLVYAGVTSAASDKDARMLVIDIGGGSTEFITGIGRKYEEAVSLNVGAVRMTEMFLGGDPPGAGAFAAMEEHVSRLVGEIAHKFGAGGAQAFTVGGTTSTLAALRLGGYDPEKVHLHEIPLGGAEEIYSKLRGMTVAQRAAMPGMEPARADIIAAGAGIFACVMRILKLDAVRVSLHDIRHGLLESVLRGEW